MKIKSELTKLHLLKFFSRWSKLPNPPKKLLGMQLVQTPNKLARPPLANPGYSHVDAISTLEGMITTNRYRYLKQLLN